MSNTICPTCNSRVDISILKKGSGWCVVSECGCASAQEQTVAVDTKKEAEEMAAVVRGLYGVGGWVFDDE